LRQHPLRPSSRSICLRFGLASGTFKVNARTLGSAGSRQRVFRPDACGGRHDLQGLGSIRQIPRSTALWLFSWLVAASDFLGGSRGPVMRSRKQLMVEVKIVSGVFLAAILGVIVLWLVSK